MVSMGLSRRPSRLRARDHEQCGARPEDELLRQRCPLPLGHRDDERRDLKEASDDAEVANPVRVLAVDKRGHATDEGYRQKEDDDPRGEGGGVKPQQDVGADAGGFAPVLRGSPTPTPLGSSVVEDLPDIRAMRVRAKRLGFGLGVVGVVATLRLRRFIRLTYLFRRWALRRDVPSSSRRCARCGRPLQAVTWPAGVFNVGFPLVRDEGAVCGRCGGPPYPADQRRALDQEERAVLHELDRRAE